MVLVLTLYKGGKNKMVYKAKVHKKFPVKSFSHGGKTSKYGKGKIYFNLPQKVKIREGIRSLGVAREELAFYKKSMGRYWKNFKIYRVGKTYVIGAEKK